MPTITITSVTDPITSSNKTACSAAGATDANTNTVVVTAVDEAGLSVGPFTATVAALGWTVSNADLSTLADGAISWEAKATALDTTTAFAHRAAIKHVTLDYITPAELRAYIGSDVSTFSAVVQSACTVASRTVEQMCGRVFLQDATPTVQYYTPDDYWTCRTDDISTTTGLIVQTDDNGDGTYPTTWTFGTDFYMEPINQIQGGITGYPFTRIQALAPRAFIFSHHGYPRQPPVKVTAKFGWATVPDAVKHATYLAAARLYKMKDAPDGFIGLAGWGPVQIKANPEIRSLLLPYMLDPYATA